MDIQSKYNTYIIIIVVIVVVTSIISYWFVANIY